MTKKVFDKIAAGFRDAIAYARGDKSDVRTLRVTRIIDHVWNSGHGPFWIHVAVDGGQALISCPGVEDYIIVPEKQRVVINVEGLGTFVIPIHLSISRIDPLTPSQTSD